MPDSQIIGGAGEGNVDKKTLTKTIEMWGKLPEKEKVKAMEQISRDYPPHYRETIEEYLRQSSRGKGN